MGVAGEAAVGTVLFGAGNQAGEQSGAAVGEQQADFDRLADEFLEFEMHVGRQAVEAVAVGLREAFFALQPVRQQGLVAQPARFGKAQAEQP